MLSRRRAYLALLLTVTVRTLVSWKSSAHAPKRPCGRPPRPPDVRRRVLFAVCRERRRQRKSGRKQPTWRSVWDALAPTMPGLRDAVKGCACALRSRAKERARARIESQRVHVEVLMKDAVWAGDGTDLGRTDQGGRVVAEHIRDIATTEAVDLSAGPPPCGEDVVAALERAKVERGCAALAFISDNGSENVNEKVERWLQENQVVHLRNLPHTPQHNASCERGHQDLKAALGIDADMPTLLLPPEAWTGPVAAAKEFLNHDLPRERLGGLTPAAFSKTLDPWYARVDREAFYKAACSAVREAVHGVTDSRERRRREREAILATLERFGVIRRTRGDARHRAQKQEGIS